MSLSKRHFIYPKEVYGFYKRAGGQTAKRNPAKTILAVIALLLLVIGLGYIAHQHLRGAGRDKNTEQLRAQQSVAGMIGAEATVNRHKPTSKILSQNGKERAAVEASPKTGMTGNPLKHNDTNRSSFSAASTPAACIRSARKCDCYTRLGTKLDTPAAMCVDIVTASVFKEYGQGDQSQQSMPASRPLENHYSSITISNSLRASKQATIAMQSHGGFSAAGRSGQGAYSLQSGS
jgi:zona occludens toxin